MVRDEIRRVLRDHDAFSETAIGEVRHALDDRRIGVRRRDDFEQVEIPRRIEEVRAEPVTPEIVGASGGQDADRNAGRVRADDRACAPRPIHALEQRALDVELLDDRFHDPVDLGDSLQIAVEAANGDQRRSIGREKRVRLQGACALEAVARDLRGEIEQQRRHARVGEMRGDLRAHRPRAEDGDRPNRRHRPRAPFAPLRNRSTTTSASASSE